jgi:acyl-CoA thioesterase-2
MIPELEELIRVLSLERLEDTLFRGVSHNIGINRVYGGQVLGQALKAAQMTVADRTVHSLHAYFLRLGDHAAPIIYEVDRSRDGKSFSARRVVAIQHGQPIFTMSASFQKTETGLEYQQSMPDIAPPDGLRDIGSYLGDLNSRAPEKYKLTTTLYGPFAFRPVEPLDLEQPHKHEPERHMWLKAADQLPDDPDLHRAMLAYISDFSLLDTNLLPHGIHVLDTHHIQVASIDHAIWFHRDFRMDEWLVYVCEGVTTTGARGLSRGRFYTTGGILVASTMQEGLIRLHSGVGPR